MLMMGLVRLFPYRNGAAAASLRLEVPKVTCALFLIWLMAAKEAMQWPGFWWCAWGRTSSLGPGGLRSLGVCVELLLVVVTSSLFPLASPVLQREFDEIVKSSPP